MANSEAAPDGGHIDKYVLGDVLGEGSFAVVRRVTRKSDGAEFAIKLVERESTSADDAEHERKILSTLGLHRHIVSLIDNFEMPTATAFVLELAEGGEVFDHICDKGAFSEADAASVIRQSALALAFMHSVGVVHRDLKPENLLLTRDNEVKVADFGLAALMGDGHPPLTEVCGTVAYMAPEIVRCYDGSATPYDASVDMFALGNILYTLIGAYNAFDPHNDRDDDEIMAAITAGKWGFSDFPAQWTSVSPAAKRVIRSLLEHVPAKRLSADALLQDRWVAGDDASDTPLPGSDAALGRFNGGRKVWRAAVHAAAIFVQTPATAAHSVASASAPPADGGASSTATEERPAKARKTAASAKEPVALPPSVLSELRTAFEIFDIDGSGSIDANEMRQVVRSLGAMPSEAERILADADTDGDGTISFEEFTALVRPLYDESGAALRKAFALFDLDSSGYIDRSELSIMLRKLGFPWQGAHIFASADTDHDGKVSFQEFVALFGTLAANKGAKAKGKRKPKK